MAECHFLAEFGVLFQCTAATRQLTMAPAALLPFSVMQVKSPKQIFGLLPLSLSNRCHGLAIMVGHQGACHVKSERVHQGRVKAPAPQSMPLAHSACVRG